MCPTSPLATAGAGINFETDVGAVFLASLLLGGPARGAAGGSTVRVLFQRKASGAPLDDLQIETEGAGGRARLDLQIKLTFSFTRGDREFASVVNACWDTFVEPSFQRAPGNRFGVALGKASQRIKGQVVRVPVWAQTSTSAAEFFDRIGTQRLASQEMRDFVEQVGDQVREHAGAAATDEALWNFFRRLVIIDFDVEQESSRDRTFAIETLRSLVPEGSVEQASVLFDRLRAAVRDAGTAGGEYNAATLQERLMAESIAVLARPSFRNDLERLREHTRLVLLSVQPAISGIVLDRSAIVADVLERMDRGQTLFLVGAPGVGKSVVLRAVGETRRPEGPVIALSGDRLAGDLAGWEGLAVMLRLERGLEELVLALSGTARPCLLIDGIERIEGIGARRAVNDLLAAINRLPRGPEGEPRWSLVITTREETLEAVREWLELPAGSRDVIHVPDLSDEEVAVLADRLPHLRWVLASSQVGPVVRNAYFLRTLEQARADGPIDPVERVTEASVHSLWWERVVGRGMDRARQQAMLRLAEQSLAQRTRRLLVGGIDAGVLSSLEADGILRRDPGTDTYWFGHDILEEWTIARVLGQYDTDVIGYLRSSGEPFWAARALQLLACARLEAEDGGQLWRDLLRQAEAEPDTNARWIDAVLTAPLRSARLGELMPRIGDVLMEENGRRLRAFLRAIRTLMVGIPRVAVWVGVLSWLAPRLADLPTGVRDEASELMASWQGGTRPGHPFRREITEAAFAWYGALAARPGERVYPAREEQPYFERLRDIVAASAEIFPDRIPGFLAELRRTSHDSDLKEWIARFPQSSLARETPAAYADFVLDILVPDWRGEGRRRPRRGPIPFSFREEDPEWEYLKQDHLFGSASHLCGPFLAILEASEAEGLRLINTLVNRATAASLRKREPGPFDADVLLDLPLIGARRFLSNHDVYKWFRPNGGAPRSVCSALMALEVWMERQIETGREPGELFGTVLSGSTSVATLAVCLGLCLAYPERCLEAAVPFMTSPLLWEFDLTRWTMDQFNSRRLRSSISQDHPAVQAVLERDERPQRQRSIRDLATLYAMQPDIALRDRVFGVIRGFPDEENAVWGDPANYKREERDERWWFYFEWPPALQARAEPYRRRLTEHINPILELSLWAKHSLDSRAVSPSMTLDEAVRRAQELQRPDDFTRPVELDGDYDNDRLEGIVGTAAAVVLLDSSEPSGHLPWCRDVLVAAAGVPHSVHSLAGMPGGVLTSAARGLLELLRSGRAGERERLAAFQLLEGPEREGVRLLFESLSDLWDREPVFCRNAVARELALAVRPWDDSGAEEPAVGEQDIYSDNVRHGRLPERIHLERPGPGDRLRTKRVRWALLGVPFARFADGTERDWVLEVTDIALGWTLAWYPEESGSYHPVDYGWLWFLGGWLARLAGTLAADDVEAHILTPLRASWPAAAAVTASVLVGYTEYRLTGGDLNAETEREWRVIAGWVLPATVDSEADPETREAVLLLIHVRGRYSILNSHWEGAPVFLDLYERWIERLGHHPWAFRALLAFAAEPGSHLDAGRTLEWLASSLARIADRESLWKEEETGHSAVTVLAGLWHRAETEVRRDPAALRRYADLLDELKRAGEPLAEQLLAKI
jgi:hypothetical protein